MLTSLLYVDLLLNGRGRHRPHSHGQRDHPTDQGPTEEEVDHKHGADVRNVSRCGNDRWEEVQGDDQEED